MVEPLERVRTFNSDLAAPSEAAIAAARQELMRAIRDESRQPSRRRVPRARRRLQWGRRVALAAALACLGIVIAGLAGSSSVTAPQSALADTLNGLARVAATQEWSGVPGPGQYLYTESEGLTETDLMGREDECQIQMVQHRQIWIATDGSGAIDQTEEDGRFTSAADEEQCALLKVTDPSTQVSSWNNSFPAHGLSFPTNNWHALSTEPATLLVQLRTLDGGPHSAGEDFVHIGDFMRESDTPPAIRAALYEAAALIPGVQLLGQQNDPTGRPGLAVGFPYPNGSMHLELIFDQRSGALLAEESFDPEDKLENWTVYQQSKIVGSHPDYPASPEQPSLSGSGTSATASPAGE